MDEQTRCDDIPISPQDSSLVYSPGYFSRLHYIDFMERAKAVKGEDGWISDKGAVAYVAPGNLPDEWPEFLPYRANVFELPVGGGKPLVECVGWAVVYDLCRTTQKYGILIHWRDTPNAADLAKRVSNAGSAPGRVRLEWIDEYEPRIPGLFVLVSAHPAESAIESEPNNGEEK